MGRTDPFAAARALTAAFRSETLRLRCGIAADAVIDALRRAARLERRYNFNPSQPRLPAGTAGGGRWTDGGGSPAGAGSVPADGPGQTPRATGPRFAQARGPSSRPSRMVNVGGGRVLSASPREETQFEMARLWADWQITRVRSVDPNWNPQPSLYSTINGAIAHQQSIVRQGDTYLNSLMR